MARKSKFGFGRSWNRAGGISGERQTFAATRHLARLRGPSGRWGRGLGCCIVLAVFLAITKFLDLPLGLIYLAGTATIANIAFLPTDARWKLSWPSPGALVVIVAVAFILDLPLGLIYLAGAATFANIVFLASWPSPGALAELPGQLVRHQLAPLVFFIAAVISLYYFDWWHIRHSEKDILLGFFAWLDPTHDAGAAVRELDARMTIEIVQLLRMVAAAWVIVASLISIARFWSGVGRERMALLLLFLTLALVFYRQLWSGKVESIPNPWSYETLMSGLIGQAYGLTERSDFGGPLLLKTYGDDFVHFALANAAFAAGVMVASISPKAQSLRARVRALTALLYPCAALVSFHVIFMAAMMLWPAAMLARSNGEAGLVLDLASASAVNFAVSYTLLLVALHLPAAYALTEKAKELSKDQVTTATGQREWLKMNDLDESWGQMYARAGATLSPLLGIPVMKLLAYIHG